MKILIAALAAAFLASASSAFAGEAKISSFGLSANLGDRWAVSDEGSNEKLDTGRAAIRQVVFEDRGQKVANVIMFVTKDKQSMALADWGSKVADEMRSWYDEGTHSTGVWQESVGTLGSGQPVQVRSAKINANGNERYIAFAYFDKDGRRYGIFIMNPAHVDKDIASSVPEILKGTTLN
jgi:hypothetical protein